MKSNSIVVDDSRLEVLDWGLGDPVVFIQTALIADELRTVATDPALEAYRKILYYRRGYAASNPVDAPGSIQRDAADCAALLTALGIDRAHVVGLSFSGAITLQLAFDGPDRVRSLILIEPPPVHVASAAEFRAANDRLIATRRDQGLQAALDEFLTIVIGDEEAARITCPVLYIGGSESGTWFAEVHDLILKWIPHAEDTIIDGADHSLALTHAPHIAGALYDFLGRHPT